MSLLHSLAHRWKSLEISGRSGCDLSIYLNKPAALLETLILQRVAFNKDSRLCEGATPSLQKVVLLYVTIPRDLSFLKNLKELHLIRPTYTTGNLSIDQIYAFLLASTNLKRLSLDLGYEEDGRHRNPIAFPELEDLAIHTTHGRDGWTSYMLSVIDAPKAINISTEFDPVPGPRYCNYAYHG